MESQSHTEVVRAPIEICFDTILEFERYPEWFSAISEATVIADEPEAGRWTVEYQLNMVVKTISYTLAYTARRPEHLKWESVAGDVKAIEGEYRFVKLEPDLTEATCTQGVDVGFWIPGPLKRTFERTALIDSVREFKVAAEKAVR